MVTFPNGRHAFAGVVMALALLTPPVAHAADMPYAPIMGNVEEERVAFGTGWYLRGDVAAASDVKLSIGGTTVPSTSNFVNSWSAGLGFGYKYNEWIRTDVTADWRSPRRFEGNTTSNLPCQIGAVAINGTDPNTGQAAVIGSKPVYARCSDYSRSRLTAFHVLFNGYIDLPTFVGITPYVGAGVGFSNVYQKFTRNWFMNNQVAYAPTWTDPYTQGTYSAYWDSSRTVSSLQFAWAAMAGVSYAISPHAAIDVGYRYMNIGSITNYASLSGTSQQTLHAHELRVGVRYTPD